MEEDWDLIQLMVVGAEFVPPYTISVACPFPCCTIQLVTMGDLAEHFFDEHDSDRLRYMNISAL